MRRRGDPLGSERRILCRMQNGETELNLRTAAIGDLTALACIENPRLGLVGGGGVDRVEKIAEGKRKEPIDAGKAIRYRTVRD